MRFMICLLTHGTMLAIDIDLQARCPIQGCQRNSFLRSTFLPRARGTG